MLYNKCYVMKKKHENHLQCEIVKSFNNNYCLRTHKPRYYIFAVQNELPTQLASMIAVKVPQPIKEIVKRSLSICLSGAINMGMRNGVSDLIVLLPKRVVFVELKSEIGKQREKQKEFQNIVEGLGFEYYVIRSIEEFYTALDLKGIR